MNHESNLSEFSKKAGMIKIGISGSVVEPDPDPDPPWYEIIWLSGAKSEKYRIRIQKHCENIDVPLFWANFAHHKLIILLQNLLIFLSNLFVKN
jgi:hypothetical protein